MIKTSINRHDMEYFVYAMTRAFYKNAVVLAPDTATHNRLDDDVSDNEDVIEFSIDEDGIKAVFSKGNYFDRNEEYSFSFEDLKKYKDENNLSLEDELYVLELKDAIRGYIYDSYVKYTGQTLPWGNLTGIRPTKLYLQKLKENANIAMDSVENKLATANYMKEKYRVSEEKNDLGVKIALREDGIINSTHGSNGYSVYIGIPFCPSTCLYCSFTSNPIFSYKNRISEYLDCIKKELIATRDIMKGYHLDTVYIGGGTPTTLEADELDRLLTDIEAILPMDEVKEFTLEAGRADSITRDKLIAIKKHAVTRISVNPQTMNDRTLKLIGRHHDADSVIQAFELARSVGFDNINMDMILGLPGENLEDVEYTLERIKELSPESLTVHSLAIKRASRMKEYMEANDISCNMNLDMAMDMAIKSAEAMNLDAYYMYRQKDMAGNLENTGFAKAGKYGIYNILMIEEVESIVALGAGSVTKRVYRDGHIERCDNSKDINQYIDRIDEMIERKVNLFSEK